MQLQGSKFSNFPAIRRKRRRCFCRHANPINTALSIVALTAISARRMGRILVSAPAVSLVRNVLEPFNGTHNWRAFQSTHGLPSMSRAAAIRCGSLMQDWQGSPESSAHSSLGYRTPNQYAQALANQFDGGCGRPKPRAARRDGIFALPVRFDRRDAVRERKHYKRDS